MKALLGERTRKGPSSSLAGSLGHFTPDHKGTETFLLRSGQDVEPLTKAFSKRLRDVALPIFDRFQSPESCLDLTAADTQLRDGFDSDGFGRAALVYRARGYEAAQAVIKDRPFRFVHIGADVVLARLKRFHEEHSGERS